ncbi:MAG: endopeptidase La [Bacteroidales bacterium]|nr:endopeptidase La [Bacteroidales bacterium]
MNKIKLDLEAMSDHRVEGSTILSIFPEDKSSSDIDMNKFNGNELPLIAARDLVLFPDMTMPLVLGRKSSRKVAKDAERHHHYIGVVTQISATVEEPGEADIYRVGCIAEVMKSLEMPDGTTNVFLHGRNMFRIDKVLQTKPFITAEVHLVEEKPLLKGDQQFRALMSNIKEDLGEFVKLIDNNLPGEVVFALQNFKDDPFLINFLCSTFPMPVARRQSLLEQVDIYERAVALSGIINQELQFAQLKSQLHEQTQANINEQQRQAYLHNQIHTIQEALGESQQDDIDRLLERANKKHWSEAVSKVFTKEINKLQRMQEQSPDYSMQFSYLQTMVDLPWGELTDDSLDLKRAQRVLDHDHYGLEKVKERILEHLAVLKMRGDMKSPILCLFGPPGVGKTSLGKSIAEALKRKYVRISLGGLHDEAEIRGHRKTYIGAMPGRIISGLVKAGADNPVFVLDEIDKISGDFRGDPASALLEVLDPEQNATFHDNYLDVDYDLSKVLFIATANDLAPIAAPLRDRMEIIDLSGYIMEEKVEIGERHLLPKQRLEHGLKDVKFSIPRNTMEAIIDQYTRESGVRLLDKRLAKIMRKVAWKVSNGETVPTRLKPEDLKEYLGMPDYDPDKYEGNDYAGVVTGLAWTSVGGTILMVESALCKGKGEKLTLTGNLGDVMKESASLALQWLKSNADYLEIPEEVFNNYTVHIHCPEGAIPKDGPSAGITMVTSLASTFTQRKVRANIAMTGEITLRGRVIPIGGVKEKILAAKRAGITDLVLCIDNKKDVEEIKPEYRSGLTFHYVRDVKEVIDYALLPEKVKNPKKLY